MTRVTEMSSTSLRALCIFAFWLSAIGGGADLGWAGEAPRVGACLKPGDCVFDPQHQAPIHFAYPGGQGALIASADNSLAISMSTDGALASKIPLPDTMAQVNEIVATPYGKIVIVGMANGAVFEVVLVDVKQSRVVDDFFAYHPTLSPNRRYIGFTKFYPPHGSNEETDIYSLYDLSRNSAENRPAGIDSSDPASVGMVVFPPTAKSTADQNVLVGKSNVHRMPMDEFVWNDDSSQYAFLNYAPQSQTINVVVVDVATRPAIIKFNAVSTAAICEKTPVAKCLEGATVKVQGSFVNVAGGALRTQTFGPASFGFSGVAR